ncbi:hypothetical protein [Amycolatopsis sp. lyj-108]
MDVLARGEMHFVPGVPGGDGERDQRVGVADRRKAGEEYSHADQFRSLG